MIVVVQFPRLMAIIVLFPSAGVIVNGIRAEEAVSNDKSQSTESHRNGLSQNQSAQTERVKNENKR